ncbi:MAG: homocysteine S-methyltransferase family protein [Verrucomicrobia bacterium]|nr:homocysteine S-methyltransferase family protein [Verrucomicrobiota bacterium]MBU4289605.1 homocysteine S-methyltransferase family protein [Verrucomicrobiota bacterium]MBU4429061.1 homocysteine S-methyltransferase family protein [Verrucomicrobiota bacterium]MCG2678747.1 homocysteine S-methyltransferase family protein [Kiritimatiellia bacterium]
MNNWSKIESLLGRGVVIGDGAIGTQLHGGAASVGSLPESLNLDPAGQDLIRKVHADYVAAGAQIIETNTFAANPLRLDPYGLADRCEEIIAQAMALARSAVKPGVLIAGSIGPLDLGLAVKDQPPGALEAAYRRQIRALHDNGADLLMLETFSSVPEARIALDESKQTGLPIFFAMGGQSVCRPYARRLVIELVELANTYQVQAVGINCLAPYDLSQVLPLLLDNTSLPILAYPNAGTPVVVRGTVQYDLPQDVLLAEAQLWQQHGVAIFGGCCGTGPEHIRALAGRFGGQPVQPRVIVPAKPVITRSRARERAITSVLDSDNPIRLRLKTGPYPLIAVEIKPALNRTVQETAKNIQPVIEAGADFLDVPDNPGANPGRDCMACAVALQQRYTVPAIIHKTATQTNALHMHSYLLGAADLGIRGILAVTGDSPHVGTFDRLANRVNDIRNSVELLRLISLLREGALMNGQPLPCPADFAAGCAFAPALQIQPQVQWLKKKAEAGAEFVFTQPVFTIEDFHRAREACSDIDIPFFFGVFPLVSVRQAVFLQSGKIPGITIPDPVVNRIAAYSSAADQAKVGMELSRNLIQQLAGECRGLYVIMPFHKDSTALTADLVRDIAGYRRQGGRCCT